MSEERRVKREEKRKRAGGAIRDSSCCGIIECVFYTPYRNKDREIVFGENNFSTAHL